MGFSWLTGRYYFADAASGVTLCASPGQRWRVSQRRAAWSAGASALSESSTGAGIATPRGHERDPSPTAPAPAGRRRFRAGVKTCLYSALKLDWRGPSPVILPLRTVTVAMGARSRQVGHQQGFEDAHAQRRAATGAGRRIGLQRSPRAPWTPRRRLAATAFDRSDPFSATEPQYGS